MGSDPIMVTITNNAPGATIRYTTTGTAPTTSSPIYTGPFEISGSAIVQAGAYQTGSNPSWPSAASYTVIPRNPRCSSPPDRIVVQRVRSSQCSRSAPCQRDCNSPVHGQTPTGTTTTGTTTFLPGNTYRYFPITVGGGIGTVTTVAIRAQRELWSARLTLCRTPFNRKPGGSWLALRRCL